MIVSSTFIILVRLLQIKNSDPLQATFLFLGILYYRDEAN